MLYNARACVASGFSRPEHLLRKHQLGSFLQNWQRAGWVKVLTCAHTQTSLRSLRKLDCVARAVPTMKAGANFAHPTVGGFVFPKCVLRATCRPYDRRNEKPGAMAGGMTHY
jgi:hypothetical protein